MFLIIAILGIEKETGDECCKKAFRGEGSGNEIEDLLYIEFPALFRASSRMRITFGSVFVRQARCVFKFSRFLFLWKNGNGSNACIAMFVTSTFLKISELLNWKCVIFFKCFFPFLFLLKCLWSEKNRCQFSCFNQQLNIAGAFTEIFKWIW